MKNLFTFFLFLCLFTAGNQSYSQGFMGSLGGGLSIPVGDLSDGQSLGYTIAGNGGYLFNKNLAARVDLAYNHYPLNDEGFIGVSGGDLSIVSLKGEFIAGDFNKSSKVIPYGFLGLGMYFASRSNLTISGLGTFIFESESNFGIDLGGGVGFRVSPNISLFGELQYNLMFSDPTTSYIPIKVGVMYTP